MISIMELITIEYPMLKWVLSSGDGFRGVIDPEVYLHGPGPYVYTLFSYPMFSLDPVTDV